MHPIAQLLLMLGAAAEQEEWTPAELGSATVLAWYEGDTLVGADGDPVTTWTDISGNNNHATGSGSARPEIEAAFLNSMNVMRFAVAGADVMSVPNIYSGKTAGSVFALMKVVNDPGDGSNVDWMDFGTAGDGEAFPWSDGTFYTGWGSNARKTTVNPSVSFSSSFRIVCIHSSASYWAFFIDGGAGGSSGGVWPAYFTFSNTVGFDTAPKLGTSTSQFHGWFAELIFTGIKLPIMLQQHVEGYLAHKWGMTGELSALHLFKNTQPVVVDPAFAVTIVKKSADQTSANYSTATVVTWDTDVVDTASCHDTGSNTSRITIPAALNGQFVVFSAFIELTGVTASSSVTLQILKNGVNTYFGWGGENNSSNNASGVSGKTWIECFTQPIMVATGDYFEAELSCNDSSVDLTAANSSFAMHSVAAALDGSLVCVPVDSGIVFFNFSTLDWNDEFYDTADYHSLTTNVSRITVPSAANGKVGVIKYGGYFTSIGGSDMAVILRKNGTADSVQATKATVVASPTGMMCAISKPYVLATNDFFTILQYVTGNRMKDRSSFGLQILNSFRGCTAKKSADQTGADYSTPTAITWNTDEIDTDAIHDTGSNTSRFTVPSALNGKYAVFSSYVGVSSFTSNSALSVCITKNGSQSYAGFGGMARNAGSTFATSGMQAFTMPVLLATGDFYEVELYSADTSITIMSAESWFGMTVLN